MMGRLLFNPFVFFSMRCFVSSRDLTEHIFVYFLIFFVMPRSCLKEVKAAVIWTVTNMKCPEKTPALSFLLPLQAQTKNSSLSLATSRLSAKSEGSDPAPVMGIVRWGESVYEWRMCPFSTPPYRPRPIQHRSPTGMLTFKRN